MGGDRVGVERKTRSERREKCLYRSYISYVRKNPGERVDRCKKRVREVTNRFLNKKEKQRGKRKERENRKKNINKIKISPLEAGPVDPAIQDTPAWVFFFMFSGNKWY